MKKHVSAMLGMAVGVCLCASAETKFTETRSVLEKWVETRQLIASTQAEWAAEKQNLQQMIELLERENKLLDEQIAKAEATTTQADKERQQLLEENEALAAAAAAIRPVVANLEKQLLELSKAFPPPLMERIEPLFKRIPTNPALTRLGLGERMQNIIGILSEADKFNNVITLVSEVKQSPTGRDVQVRTIYLGLGAAFFTDKSGQFAGVGVPTAEGWQWTPRPELAPKIAKAIFIYENAAAAEFVPLPVQIK
jgi:hypothetical protein